MKGAWTASDIAAWYGAAIATAVFLWDIAKWLRSGPKLIVRVNTGMERTSPAGHDPTPLIFVTVQNVGDQATTITHLFGQVFSGRIAKLMRRRPQQRFVLTNPQVPIPKKIEPGEQWSAWHPEKDIKALAIGNAIVEIGIHHSMAKKPVVDRAIFMIEKSSAS